MKAFFSSRNLPWFTLGFAALALIPGALLTFSGAQKTGLTDGGSVLFLLMWAVSLVFAALLFLLSRQLRQGDKYSFNFPSSQLGAIGAAVGALGILFSCLHMASFDFLGIADTVLGIAAAAALAFLAHCRRQGRHPSIVFFALICGYLMVDLICVYRLRSANPQVWQYCFSLLASVLLMLACYQSAAFAANSGSRRMHTLTHLGAVYLCALSLLWSENPIFYLTVGVWMFTDLCDLTPMPTEQR